MKNKLVTFEVAFDWLDKKMERIFDKKERVNYEGLSKEEKMIYLLYSYDSSVRNGGIKSFLDQQNGERFEELIANFKELHAAAVAMDLEEVINVLRSVNKDAPLSLRADLDEFDSLPIANKFRAVECENTKRYFEYDPNPLQLLYGYLNSRS
ncbi:MAG: DUF4375 domain-containing protein [Bdellovibrionia bacterium]